MVVMIKRVIILITAIVCALSCSFYSSASAGTTSTQLFRNHTAGLILRASSGGYFTDDELIAFSQAANTTATITRLNDDEIAIRWVQYETRVNRIYQDMEEELHRIYGRTRPRMRETYGYGFYFTGIDNEGAEYIIRLMNRGIPEMDVMLELMQVRTQITEYTFGNNPLIVTRSDGIVSIDGVPYETVRSILGIKDDEEPGRPHIPREPINLPGNFQEFLQLGFIGLGGGLLLSGVAWLLGLLFTACYSIIFKNN